MRFQKFVHRMLGVEVPDYYHSLIDLKRIIELTEYRNPKNFEHFIIVDDGKKIEFTARTIGSIRNVKLKSLELRATYESQGMDFHIFRADYKEYKEVYERRLPIVSYIEEQVRPVYDVLASDPHPKYKMLLMQYEGSLSELAFALNESLRVNKVVTREMELKTIEGLMGLVDAAQEIALEFKQEEEYFTEKMNKILMSKVDDEVHYIKTSLRGSGR